MNSRPFSAHWLTMSSTASKVGGRHLYGACFSRLSRMVWELSAGAAMVETAKAASQTSFGRGDFMLVGLGQSNLQETSLHFSVFMSQGLIHDWCPPRAITDIGNRDVPTPALRPTADSKAATAILRGSRTYTAIPRPSSPDHGRPGLFTACVNSKTSASYPRTKSRGSRSLAALCLILYFVVSG